MKAKGGVGVAALLLKAHDIVDIVKIILPSPTATKQVQEKDTWGDNWVCSTIDLKSLDRLLRFYIYQLEKLRISVDID